MAVVLVINQRSGKPAGCPTKRALDGWDSAAFSGFFYTRTESCSRSFISARPPASNASRWATKSKTKFVFDSKSWFCG